MSKSPKYQLTVRISEGIGCQSKNLRYLTHTVKLSLEVGVCVSYMKCGFTDGLAQFSKGEK